MSVLTMYWDDNWGRDLHVLRGQVGPRLGSDALKFSLSDQTDDVFVAPYAEHHPEVDVWFRPFFLGEESADFVYSGHGIHVDEKAGGIAIDALAPPLTKNNFIIEVTATEGDNTFTRKIRVHIHKSVVRIWLTPDTLTVRPSLDPPELTKYRFTARAEFDDGVVGDVTFNHGLVWSSASGNVDPTGRLILTGSEVAGEERTITATYSPIAGSGSASARLRVARRWSEEPSPPEVSIIPGGGWPGTIRPEEVPNVLFLGDGFTQVDEDAFEAITNGYVSSLKSDRMARPFDLLATSINFWRSFVPTSENAISVRNEVYAYDKNGKTLARSIPPAEEPIGDERWSLSNLIYVVGLPVPADQAKSNATLRAEWAVQVDPDPADDVKSDDLIDRWKRLGNRSFIDEVDAFPGMSYGAPPAAEADDTYSLDFHDDRGGIPQALLPFYQILESDEGVKLDGNRAVGQIWASNEDAFAFDNTDLIVMLTALPGGRSLNATGYIALSTETEKFEFEVTEAPDRKAFLLEPFDAASSASADSCRTLAHELAHSFGCGDEYVDFRLPYPDQNSTLSDSANLATEQSTEDADGDTSGDEIKWNWHRIHKAGVIDDGITAAGDTFMIPLKLDHGSQFAAGDKVLIRERDAKTALQKRQRVLRNQLIADDPPPAELEILDPVQPNLLTVSPVVAGSVTLGTLQSFHAGSIVYIPTPAPDSVNTEGYPYAEMIALNIKQSMSDRNRPLTPVPCANKSGHYLQVPDLTGVDLPLCFSHKPRIVGLYEGGGQFACDIFHPTGTCMMRGNHDESAEFCAVCRYVIVDFVNPYLHSQIDLDYDEIYPQR